MDAIKLLHMTRRNLCQQHSNFNFHICDKKFYVYINYGQVLTCLTNPCVFLNIGWDGVLIRLWTQVFSNLTFTDKTKSWHRIWYFARRRGGGGMDVSKSTWVLARLVVDVGVFVGGWVGADEILRLYFFWDKTT